MTAIKEEYTFKKLLSVANYGSHNNSNQFSNLNLNRGHKCPSSDQSLSKSNNHKYSGGNVKNDYKEERKAWKNKSTKDSSVIKSKCSRLSTNEAVKETEDQKRWKNGKESKKLNSSSTLSLHIAAYENNIESFSKDDDNKNLQPKSKALKFVESLSNLHDSQDLLEFPRQMADDKSSTTPEVQQFAASQRLFSPNQGMRIPEGAPIQRFSWLWFQTKFPSLRKVTRPSLGTVGVIATVTLTVFAVYAVGIQPKINNEYYRQSQAEKRSTIKATREELAQGLPVWKDPFDRK